MLPTTILDSEEEDEVEKDVATKDEEKEFEAQVTKF